MTMSMDAPDYTSEQWLPIPGYEGLYEVSDHGRVRTLHSGKMRYRSILVQRTHNGYRTVGLSCNGKYRQRRVHQLVLEAFVGPRPPGFITRHLNDVRHDNRLANLAWGTHSENIEDARRNGSFSGRRHLGMWNR